MMETVPNASELQAENEALRALLAKRGEQLYDTLAVLVDMWNQYCPPPRTHLNMMAGEDTEEILKEWGLLLPDETAIELHSFFPLPDDVKIPQRVLALIGLD